MQGKEIVMLIQSSAQEIECFLPIVERIQNAKLSVVILSSIADRSLMESSIFRLLSEEHNSNFIRIYVKVKYLTFLLKSLVKIAGKVLPKKKSRICIKYLEEAYDRIISRHIEANLNAASRRLFLAEIPFIKNSDYFSMIVQSLKGKLILLQAGDTISDINHFSQSKSFLGNLDSRVIEKNDVVVAMNHFNQFRQGYFDGVIKSDSGSGSATKKTSRGIKIAFLIAGFPSPSKENMAKVIQRRNETSCEIVVFLRDSYMSREDYKFSLGVLADVMKETCGEMMWVLKPHPRQRFEDVANLFLGIANCTVTNELSSSLLQKCNKVVTFWSGLSIKCFYYSVPCIEFFNHDSSKEFQMKAYQSVTATSIYKDMGIVFHASNKGELIGFLRNRALSQSLPSNEHTENLKHHNQQYHKFLSMIDEFFT